MATPRRPRPRPRGAADSETGRALLGVALRLFRRKGFDGTTMRDVAREAGVALGAAYYYFPSKEAMLLAYYDLRRREHEQRAHAALATAKGFRARVGAVVHASLDVFPADRKLLAALARSVGDPLHPLSVFGARTRPIRDASIALFDEALSGTEMPADLRGLLAPALWVLHLGFILYYVNDGSARQARTRRLVDGTLDLLATLVPFATMPGMEAMRAQVVGVLVEAGLLPQES